MRNKIILMPLWVLGFMLLQSCSGYDKEELALLKKDDPRFSNMMALKEQTQEQSKMLNSRLSQYKETMDNKIADMRQSYQQQKSQVQDRVNALKEKVRVNRDTVEKELTELANKLERKKRESSDVTADLKAVEGMLGRQDTLEYSSSELKNLQDRKIILERRLVPLNEEIDELSSLSNMAKKKLKYL